MNSMKNKNYVLSMMFLLLTLGFSQNTNAGFVMSNGFAFEGQSLHNSSFTDKEQAKKIGNEVVDKLVAGDFEGIAKKFDETMKKSVSAQQIKELWTQVKTAVGEYQSRNDSQIQERDNNFGAFTVCQMAKGKVMVEVWVDGNGKIAGLWIKPA